jgi:hypothetical protein
MKNTIFLLLILAIANQAIANQIKKDERNGYQLLKSAETPSILGSKSISSINYTTAIGVRFGFEGGLTVKHFISSDRAIEGIFSRGWNYPGFRLTGLYEIHAGAFDVDGLSWFYGIGGHIGNGKYRKDRWGNYNHEGTVIGIDGIIGMEYRIQEIPFSVSLDLKPAIDILGLKSNYFGDVALSIRYIIK